MTGRIRQIIVFGASACLLLASNRTSAQTPPAGSDSEQRLKALEVKLDRVLKSLDARPITQSMIGTVAASRDNLRAILDETEKERQTFLRRSRFTSHQADWVQAIAESLGKYEARRAELRLTMADMASQLDQIERAYKKNGNEVALGVIRVLGLEAKGNADKSRDEIIALLTQKRQKALGVYGEDHPKVKEVDEAIAQVRKVYSNGEASDARAFIERMNEEIGVQATKIETVTNLIEIEKKNARELDAFEKTEERFRREGDTLRTALKALDAILGRDETQKPK